MNPVPADIGLEPELTQDAGPEELGFKGSLQSLEAVHRSHQAREDRQTLISAASIIAGGMVSNLGISSSQGIVRRSLEIAKGIISTVDAESQ